MPVGRGKVHPYKGLQAETKNETLLHHCAQQQGPLWWDTRAFELLRGPSCALPTLSVLRGPSYGVAPLVPNGISGVFFKMKISLLLFYFFSYGTICAHC